MVRKWDEELIRICAKEYELKSQFKKKYYQGWKVAKDLGILDDLGFKTVGNRLKRCIYAVEFSDNCVYIGLTYNFKARLQEHVTKKKSPVYKHTNDGNIKLRCFIKLTDYIDASEASILEGEFVEKYRRDGWTILNTAKTGTLGSPDPLISLEYLQNIFSRYESWEEIRDSEDYHFYEVAKKRKLINKLYYKNKEAKRFLWDQERALSILNNFRSRAEASKDTVGNRALVYIERKNLKHLIKWQKY